MSSAHAMVHDRWPSFSLSKPELPISVTLGLLQGHGQGLAQAADDLASLNACVSALYDAGKCTEAIPLAEKALALTSAQQGPEHVDTAARMNLLAVLYRHHGRATEAEPLYKRSLGIREKALGPDHPDIATSLNNLAFLYVRWPPLACRPPWSAIASIINRLGAGAGISAWGHL